MADFVAEANTLIQKFIIEFQNLQAGVINQIKYNAEQIIMLNNALEKVNAENKELKNKLEIVTPKDEGQENDHDLIHKGK